MLGKCIIDGVEFGFEQMDGLGLLDVEIEFVLDKVIMCVSGYCQIGLSGILKNCCDYLFEGYEIYMGVFYLGSVVIFFVQLILCNG